MAIVTLQSSDRSRKKQRFRRRSTKAFGSRHGDEFWEEEKKQNNFGLKYMNKYGWNRGDGLGKNRQGDTQHVKTRLKNDNKGVGCKHAQLQNDTMFQATMCMFNDILSGLNTNKKKKKKSDSSQSNSKSQDLSASAIIKSYEAKHHLLSIHLHHLSLHEYEFIIC